MYYIQYVLDLLLLAHFGTPLSARWHRFSRSTPRWKVLYNMGWYMVWYGHGMVMVWCKSSVVPYHTIPNQPNSHPKRNLLALAILPFGDVINLGTDTASSIPSRHQEV